MRGHVPRLSLILFLLFSQWSTISYGDESARSGPESIFAKYHETEKELEIISGTVPFYVESSVNKNTSHVDIYGTVKYPFDIYKK